MAPGAEPGRFNHLEVDAHYDIIDPENGHLLTEGVQGSDAMRRAWPQGATAHEAAVGGSELGPEIDRAE